MSRARNSVSPAELDGLRRVGWREVNVTVSRGIEHHNMVRRKRIQSIVVSDGGK